MTVDHKPTDPAEVSRVEAAGGLVARNRVDGLLAVSRSIGDITYKDNPALPYDKQKVIPVPVITNITITNDNFLFICCDGIFETFTNEEAIAFIHDRLKANPEEDTAKILSDLLYAVLNKGSKDNMTAMIIEVKDGTTHAKPNEFVVGEFHEWGNETFVNAYRSYCEKNGKKFSEAQAEWQKRAKEIEEKSQLSLEDLSAKLCRIDCLAANALRDAFMNAESSGKLQRKVKETK